MSNKLLPASVSLYTVCRNNATKQTHAYREKALLCYLCYIGENAGARQLQNRREPSAFVAYISQVQYRSTTTVSYTHLDVYKRQI